MLVFRNSGKKTSRRPPPPMPSRKQLATALNFLDSIPDATSLASVKTDSRGSMAKDGLQGGTCPCAVGGRRLGEHVSHEMYRATLVFHLGKHGID